MTKEVKYQAKVTYTNLNKKRTILTQKLDTPEDVCVWMSENNVRVVYLGHGVAECYHLDSYEMRRITTITEVVI